MVIPEGKNPVTLDVRSVTPRYALNTADARVRVLICRRNDSVSACGADDLWLCASTRGFTPGSLTIDHDNAGTTSIVLAITTRRFGAVTIAGVHVTYRDGIRRGSPAP
jgi:hypothetical protein